MTNYNIRPLHPDDIPNLTKLFVTCFHFHAKDAELAVAWKYASSFKRNLISYVATTPDGTIVSHYANLETPVLYKGKLLSAFNCIDMATHPDHRGQGLISTLSKRVYAEVAKTEAVLSFGFSNEQGVQVDKHAKGYGYTVVGKFTRSVKLILPGSKPNDTLQEIQEFDADPHQPEDTVLRIAKSQKYLTWRYQERPEKTYRLYAWGQGYVVLLAQAFKLVILDIVGIEKGQIPAVLTAIEAEARRLGKTMIINHVLDNSLWQACMHAAGFHATPARTQTYLTVKVHKPESFKTRDVYNPNSWSLMTGDIW